MKFQQDKTQKNLFLLYNDLMFYLYVLFSASAVNSFDNEWEPNTTSICSFSQKKKKVTKSVSLLFS